MHMVLLWWRSFRPSTMQRFGPHAILLVEGKSTCFTTPGIGKASIPCPCLSSLFACLSALTTLRHYSFPSWPGCHWH